MTAKFKARLSIWVLLGLGVLAIISISLFLLGYANPGQDWQPENISVSMPPTCGKWHIARRTYDEDELRNATILKANFSDVLAVSPDNAWVVGEIVKWYPNIASSSMIRMPVMLHWNGVSWQQMQLPRMPSRMRGTGSNLAALDASADQDVWVVGTWADKIALHPYAARWVGGKWEQVDVPMERSYWAELTDVDVRSPMDVRVRGYRQSRAPYGPEQDLSLHWNGTAWTPMATEWEGGTVDVPPDIEGWVRSSVLPTLGSSREFSVKRMAVLGEEHIWVAGASGYDDVERAVVAYFRRDSCPK